MEMDFREEVHLFLGIATLRHYNILFFSSYSC